MRADRPRTPRKLPLRQSLSHAAAVPASTATPLYSWPPTGRASRTWTTHSGAISPGTRSSKTRTLLNLDPHQVRQATTQHEAADGAVTARLPEAYQWVLTPGQKNPRSPIEWQATRLTGSDPLALRAARRLRSDELLVGKLGSVLIRRALDDIPLWRGDHVPIRTLVDDFAQQLYLQRLDGPAVLADALRSGVGSLTWQLDTFAYAESFDDTAGRYLNLQAGRLVEISPDDPGLIVEPDVAQRQLEADARKVDPLVDPPKPEPGPGPGPDPQPPQPDATLHRRYHGTVELDPTRVGRDASQIAQEVVAHLATLADAEVTVTIDIEANLPKGATDHAIRTVTENGRTLNFHPGSGFERD